MDSPVSNMLTYKVSRYLLSTSPLPPLRFLTQVKYKEYEIVAHSNITRKILVQCDFDGTITMDDVSFLLLDAFADGDWRQLLEQYKEGKIPVGQFNMQAFAMVKSDRRTLLDFMKDKVEIRAGFNELLSYCQQQGFRFVIVSNGLNFYIEDILKGMGITNIKVFAAQTRFDPKGVEVKYIGPDGDELQDNFKVAYTRLFLNMGYQVIYLGNGISDLSPASQSHHVFATGELSDACKQANVNCTVFTDLNEVVRRLELL